MAKKKRWQKGKDAMMDFSALEIAYLCNFCSAESVGHDVRLRDFALRDMYSHNLTYLTQTRSDKDFLSLLQTEAEIRRTEKMPFLNLTLEFEPTEAMLTLLRQAAGEHAVYDYYVFGGNSPVARPDCAASPMTIETAPAALAFDLRCNGKDFGTDFIRRRFYRRAQVYLGGEILHMLCWHAGRIVGTCDFFLYGNVLKLEDFDVAPEWQRQGFGTAVLRQLIARGQYLGAKAVYLITDASDTTGEMYQKCGFLRVGRKHELLFPV